MCFGVPGVPRCFIFLVKFDTKHDFNCTWYLAMRANDNVGTILAHPDKGRLWGGTEWPCSGGSLRHPASNVLFFSPRICTWSLVSESLWSRLLAKSQEPRNRPKVVLRNSSYAVTYLSLSGWFRGFPKKGNHPNFHKITIWENDEKPVDLGIAMVCRTTLFTHSHVTNVPTGLFAVWRPTAWQASFAERAETATGDPGRPGPGWNPAGSHCTRFLGTMKSMKCQQTAEGFLGFGVFLLSPLAALHTHTNHHKSTWHAFCVAWPAREFARMLQQQGWQINIQNNLLVFMCCRQIWMYFGATFCIGREYIGHPLTDTTGWQQIHGHGLNGKTVCAPQVLGMRSQMTLDSMHLQYFSTRKYGLPEIMSLCLSRLWMFESVKHVAQTAWHFFGATPCPDLPGSQQDGRLSVKWCCQLESNVWADNDISVNQVRVGLIWKNLTLLQHLAFKERQLCAG